MRRSTIFVAAALLATPAQVIANGVGDSALAAVAGAEADDEEEGNNRLGLLGLLGLAGLLGLIRREPDIHVDARRDKRG